MKYAIPVKGTNTWDELVETHFGRAPYFAVWDKETDEVIIVKNESNHFGGVGMPAEFLSDKCNGLICGGIGIKAIQLCNQLGLSVYVGASGTVKTTVEDFKMGKIKEAAHGDGCVH